jgi:hypothetical protein
VVLTESGELVLKRTLNFAVINTVSNLDMVCVAESASIHGVLLEKSKRLTSKIIRKESMALKSLKEEEEEEKN